MLSDVILFLTLNIGIPMVVEKVGKDIFKRLSPSIERARKRAVKKMAKELGSGFPSINFLEMNFRFDSPEMKNQLKNLIFGREIPDENILKQEMAKEVSQKWPKFSDKAEEIVDSFLKYFEQECLASIELRGFTLASIIREEHTATQQVVHKESEAIRELIKTNFSEIRESLIQTISTSQETAAPAVTSILEEKFLKERDDLLDLVKKWQSAGLYGKIQKLAEDVSKVRKNINPSISGSIFRLCGAFILRSLGDREKAKFWIDLAEEAEPYNHRTAALKAEFLCFEKKWDVAKEILDPIADSSDESFVKIIYAESLSHVLGISEAFEWLKKQNNVKDEEEIKLNLAIFAAKNGEDAYALNILKKLKEKPYPGPYPYLLTAEILVKQSTPRDLISISAPEDIELQKNYDLLLSAISDLKKGIELLNSAARPLKEIAHTAHSLSELYLTIEDISSAEKYLCQYWRQLRKEIDAWFTASSIAFLKGAKDKALARSQKALKISEKGDYKSLFRYALLCINMEEWDKCLETINSIAIDELDEEHSKAILQMRVICYFQKEDYEHEEKSIQVLKKQFPKDEMWVILKALILTQRGRTDEAINLLVEESTNFPDSLKIKLRLASLYRQKKKYSDALPLYKEIANLLGTTNSYENACAVALEGEKPEEVFSVINDAERSGITSDNLKHFRAIALTMNKQYDEALGLFSTFPRDSLNINDYISYAFCYVNKANPEKAIGLLNKAKIKYPGDIRIIRTLYSLYLEINQPEKAFKEANIWLEENPDDKGAYFAVIIAGFATGEGETAHKAIMNYLSRFGEGPELRWGKIEEVKEILRANSEQKEFLWRKYQDGLLPEIILSQNHTFGTGSGRIMLLESNARVMAFNGNPDGQKRQFIDTLTEKEILIDYHALITICLLDLFKPTLALFQYLSIPEVVLNKLREDLVKLSTSYQKDRRYIEEGTFSKVKEMFQINKTFPQVNPKDVPESLGNRIYDLLTCKDKNCSYVVPGFERKELSDIKSIFNIEPISVLDIADLMKNQGIITVANHARIVEALEKYNLKGLRKLESIPGRLMFDWNALEMLEECKLLEHIPKLTKDMHIGPFSYAVLRSDTEKYRVIDDLQDKLKNIRDKISNLIQKDKVKTIPPSGRENNTEAQNLQELPGFEYIEGIKNICKEKKFVLWSDDSGLNGLSASEGIKTTCTRTILDVLLAKKIVTKEYYVQKLAQILKWNMFFCWINVDAILKCAEMYNYSMSEDLKAIIGSLTNEMRNYLNQAPNKIEKLNFNVASIGVQKLWLISGKAQALAMRIFDEVHAAVKAKESLNRFWISKCILDFASIGELPLGEFLRNLSLRMTGRIKDELKEILIILLKRCLVNRKDTVVQTGSIRVVAANIIKAIKVAIPGYKDELISLTLKLDPTMKALI